jgi:HSP20 family protein
MLMRTDLFRDLDRRTQQVLGTAAARPRCRWTPMARATPFHLPGPPGISVESIDLTVEQNVLTVRADRVPA